MNRFHQWDSLVMRVDSFRPLATPVCLSSPRSISTRQAACASTGIGDGKPRAASTTGGYRTVQRGDRLRSRDCLFWMFRVATLVNLSVGRRSYVAKLWTEITAHYA